MIDTAEHIISNLATTNQIPLKDNLVPVLIDLLQKESLVVPIILLSA